MITVTRTNSEHPGFQSLVVLLDAHLALRDGAEHAFYAVYNKTASLAQVVVVYEDENPVGCGAFKSHEGGGAEIKRMYVLPEYRGRGIAAQILKELESWAAELLHTRCILETGRRQPEAIALYRKNGYTQIPNYGQYAGVENSICFEKNL